MDNRCQKLLKFRQSPGTCTYIELLDVKYFLNEFKILRDVYRYAFCGVDPQGETIESYIEDVNWYLKRDEEGMK